MPSLSIFDSPLNLNYAGSSGYGANPSGRYGLVYTPPPKDATTGVDYGVYDPAQNKVISLKTGKPWTGLEPRTGQYYTGGVAGSASTAPGVKVPFSDKTINPNDPSQRYQPVDIVKNPDIAQGEQDLMAQFKQNAASSLKDFGSYLSNFKTDLGTARTAAASATDIAPTVSALQDNSRRYQQSLTGDMAQLSDINATNAKAEQGIVGQANALLPQYDAAARAVADQQFAAVAGNLNRIKAGGSTPTSMGSDEERVLAQAAAQVYAPMEQAKIDRQYQLLQGLALPVQRDITDRAASAVTGFNAPTQGNIYQSGVQTANQIQSLKTQVAGMTMQQALSFLQSAGVPAQIAQQVLSGQIGQLGQLGQIEQSSRYQGLQDLLGVTPSQPVGYNTATPPLPTYRPNRYGSPGVPGQPLLGPDASPSAGPISSANPDYTGYRGVPNISVPGAGPGVRNYGYPTSTGYSPGTNVDVRGPASSYSVNPDGTVQLLGPGAAQYRQPGEAGSPADYQALAASLGLSML